MTPRGIAASWIARVAIATAILSSVGVFAAPADDWQPQVRRAAASPSIVLADA